MVVLTNLMGVTNNNILLDTSKTRLRMLNTHQFTERIDASITETDRERGQSLEERVLDLLEAEFAGVIRSHVRGEVYGGR